MKYPYTVAQLESCKKTLERDIAWYKEKNKPGVNLSDQYRKERIAECTGQLTEVNHVLKLLADGRFTAIEANLIQFNVIEANLIALESMVRKISPKHSEMKQECIDVIQDVLGKYFHTHDNPDK